MPLMIKPVFLCRQTPRAGGCGQQPDSRFQRKLVSLLRGWGVCTNSKKDGWDYVKLRLTSTVGVEWRVIFFSRRKWDLHLHLTSWSLSRNLLRENRKVYIHSPGRENPANGEGIFLHPPPCPLAGGPPSPLA